MNCQPQTHQYQAGKQGVCVQIGLFDIAELLYLAQPNWKANIEKQTEINQIPVSVADRFSSWRYLGVDCDGGSIVKMLEKYGNSHGVQWVHAAVGKYPDQMTKLLSHFGKGYFYGYGCSLQRLFQLLGLSQVDVLKVDIEGHEIGMFACYDWKIRPAYISVEVHGDHNHTSKANPVMLMQHIDIVHRTLAGQGYKQIGNIKTNPNSTGYCTCELQYLL